MEANASQASVLVVDDDPKSLQALKELLRGLAPSIVLANSGEAALRCVLKQDFAVILMDVRMPGADGFATARLIREHPRSHYTPIIFVTGADEDLRSMFRGYEAGAVDYILKPVVPEILKSKISVFIDLYYKNEVLTREIAERKRAEEDLKASQENLRALAARLQSVREEEWKRISREIHDELGQALTGLKMDLTWVAHRLLPKQKALAQRTRSMFSLIDDTVQSVREIATRLRPEVLDELGLAAAIGWQARDFQMRTGIRCKVSLPADPPPLDQERSTAAFRVFQELLTNVARHANATRVDVMMQADADRLMLVVEDNGKGIAEEEAVFSPKSMGLLGMRERMLPFGGNIEIRGRPGKGTRVTVSVPVGLK